MKTQTQTTGETLNISREKLVSFVSQIFGGQDFPNPDDPPSPGPWDPYIHRALSGLRAHRPKLVASSVQSSMV